MNVQHREVTRMRMAANPFTENRFEQYRKIWRQTYRLRNYETELKKRYAEPFPIRCPVHYAIGQELMSACIMDAKQNADRMFCHHRNHNHFLSWTYNALLEMLAELMGKEDGVCKGRAGSQEISWAEEYFHSGAILSGMLPIAAGAAFALKYEEVISGVASFTDAQQPIVFCVVGDGAADEGVFWETINFAAVYQLPILFIVENNGYATHSEQEVRQRAAIASRVTSFGVPGHVTGLPGQRIDVSMLTLLELAQRVRDERRPLMIEHMTYRFNGHVGAHDDSEAGSQNGQDTYRRIPKDSIYSEKGLWACEDDLVQLERFLMGYMRLNIDEIDAAYKEDDDAFNLAWYTALEKDDAIPIDHETAGIYTGDDFAPHDIEVPYEAASECELLEFRETILTPY